MFTLTAQEKSNLCSLADALFPIDTWINQRQNNVKAIPIWRTDSAPVNAVSLQAIEFILSGLVNNPLEEDRDLALAKRWNELIETAPDAYTSRLKMKNWRTDRGLDSDPAFAPVDSENFTVGEEQAPPPPKPKLALSRGQFYKSMLGHFISAVTARNPTDWTAFSVAMAKHWHPGTNTFGWPPTAPPAAEFIVQFERDLAIAYMSLRNLGVPSSDLVLVEAGEHRRKGNNFTPADVAQSVKDFNIVLRQFVP